ncbi:MAG TPA: hypothetical protein VD995_04710 [Azospirillum sp.]|nr:hypothetical protein [Azospirillum sp.]
MQIEGKDSAQPADGQTGLERLSAEYMRLDLAAFRRSHAPDGNSSQAVADVDRLLDDSGEIHERMLNTPALSPRDIAAKLAIPYMAFVWMIGRPELITDTGAPDRLADGCLRDLWDIMEEARRMGAHHGTASADDAELWRIVHDLRAVAREGNSHGAPYPASAEIEDDINDRRAALFEKLFATPAQTVFGIAAKLHATVWPWYTERHDQLDPPDEADDEQTRRVWEIITEAEALGRRAKDEAFQSMLSRMTDAQLNRMLDHVGRTLNDDAELFALWRAYEKARDELNAYKGENEEADRLCDIFRKAEMAFVTAPAHTVAGVALKFQFIAWERSQDPHLMDDLPDDIASALTTGTDAIERLAAYGAAGLSAEQTSTIPVLGMTFRQAADRVRDQLEWVERSASQDPDDAGPEKEQRAATADERRRLNEAIMTTPAQTLGDVLVKLERLACPYTGAGVFEIAESDITAITDDLRRIADRGALPVAAPVVDSFADTIAAFEAEQSGMLSVPFVPTQVMEDAAVKLAGITPAQFRYAYAAALEACKKEKAA